MCPRFLGVGLLDDLYPVIRLEDCVPRSYPPEFRRRVLALVEAGRPVAQVAAEVGISDQAIYGWHRQQLIDSGRLPSLTQHRARRVGGGP